MNLEYFGNDKYIFVYIHRNIVTEQLSTRMILFLLKQAG